LVINYFWHSFLPGLFIDPVCFNKVAKVFRDDAVAPTKAYGSKLTLMNVPIDGEEVKLKDFRHLLRGE
jgi:hypothetical protein